MICYMAPILWFLWSLRNAHFFYACAVPACAHTHLHERVPGDVGVSTRWCSVVPVCRRTVCGDVYKRFSVCRTSVCRVMKTSCSCDAGRFGHRTWCQDHQQQSRVSEAARHAALPAALPNDFLGRTSHCTESGGRQQKNRTKIAEIRGNDVELSFSKTSNKQNTKHPQSGI